MLGIDGRVGGEGGGQTHGFFHGKSLQASYDALPGGVGVNRPPHLLFLCCPLYFCHIGIVKLLCQSFLHPSSWSAFFFTFPIYHSCGFQIFRFLSSY